MKFDLINRKGYVATTTVLIIMAVLLTISSAVTLLSIGSAQGSVALHGGEKAWNLTESCMENALGLVRESVAYFGGTVTLPDGNCTIGVVKIGTSWTVTALPVSNSGYRRGLEVKFTRLGTGIFINSWTEI